jgi:hypothetical protein
MKKTPPLLLLALFAASLPGAHAALLLGWYRFDDPTNLGKDYSGNNNNGTVIDNGAEPVYTASGHTGGAADFRGSGKINIPFDTGPSLWPNLTWGGWVNPDAPHKSAPSPNPAKSQRAFCSSPVSEPMCGSSAARM